MNLSSLNIRGLCSGPKRAALKHLLSYVNPQVVLLQETMLSSVSTVNFFLKLKPGWLATDVDTIGLSGGTLLTWNPCMANLRA